MTRNDLIGRTEVLPYILPCILVVLALMGSARPAGAQIYSWRDANGNLVVSNVQHSAGAQVQSYAVPKAGRVRATRAVRADATRQYDDLISEHARTSGVRTDLVRAVIQVESAYNPYAKSPKGALGLMQLMPATIKQFGVVNPFSPRENIRAGVAYLRALLDRYSNNEEIALAAYNAGPGAVDRYSQNIPPYRETQNYVAKVSEIAGPQAKISAGTSIYRIVQVVDGQERVIYSTNPAARINPAVLPPSDPASRTPAQVLRSSGVFRTP